MKAYRIRDWDQCFENNRSRKVETLSWVSIPNKHDGECYSLIMADQNAAKIYSAWILTVQVASKCNPRGTLIRDNGQPHTSQTLAIKTRAPSAWFDLAFNFLTTHTDWLEVVELAPDCHPPATQVPPACHPTDEGGKGKEGKEGMERTAPAEPLPAPDRQPTTERPTLEEIRAFAVSPHCGFPPARIEEWYHDQEAQAWRYAANWKSRLLADRNKEYWRKSRKVDRKEPMIAK